MSGTIRFDNRCMFVEELKCQEAPSDSMDISGAGCIEIDKSQNVL